MEDYSDLKKMTQVLSIQKGGLRTMPFIIANEAFEKVASYGLLPNMIVYLMDEYHMDSVTGTSVLFFWAAFTNFTPLLGAFLSDSCFGRFRTIGLGSIASLLGMILLWLTTMVPEAKPPPCGSSFESCRSPTMAQLTLLFSSLSLISIGAGGIRPCSLAFGADQLARRDNPNNERVLQSFFNLYYASATASILVSLTVIVYVQDNMGWKVGFGIPAIFMLFSTVMFFLASSFYVKVKTKKSLLSGFAKVLVVAFKNRFLTFPPKNISGYYHYKKGSTLVAPTDQLRLLNKACIINRSPEEDLITDGLISEPVSTCTVEQVEELKALIKVIPLWSTGIMMAVSVNQNSFPLLQANSMNRHITSNFQIPAGSFAMFLTITMVVWLSIYDRLIVPLLAKFTGRPNGLDVKQRMGIGLLFSCMAMAVSAIVESIRRRTAIQQGFVDDPHAVVDMSAMWLVPQHILNGLAEAFSGVGQTEFYYSQFPKSMSSIASAFFGLGMAVANLLGNVIVRAVDDVTKRGGKNSWVSSNINKAHYDNYYWLLAVMGLVNFLYFLVCYRAYGPSEGEGTRVEEREGTEEEEELP